MTYKTHVRFGILLANILLYNIYIGLGDILLFLVFMVITAITAIVPDIDHPKSHINKTIIPLFIVLLGALHQQYCLLLVWYILAHIIYHRKFTHSLIGIVIFAIPFYKTYFIPVIIGYASHIIADMLFGGVFLFWPSKKRITILNIKTGSFMEKIIHVILLMINGYILITKIAYII